MSKTEQTTKIITNVPNGSRVSIETDKKSKSKMQPYLRFGRKVHMKSLINKPFEEVMQELSRKAYWFYWELVKIRDEKTNLAKILPKTEYEKKKFYTAYNELAPYGLVIRIKRGTYMLDPDVVSVWGVGDYEEKAFIAWEKAKRKNSIGSKKYGKYPK